MLQQVSTPHQSKYEHLQMQRLHLPKFHLFSSKEFEEYKKKPVSPKPDVFSPSGMSQFYRNALSTSIRAIEYRYGIGIWWLMFLPYSDGIARVHGMSNVQAEELVE